MAEAHSTYGGISEQVFCNAHEAEQSALSYWTNILALTPYDYDWVIAWELWWALSVQKPAIRREVFEIVYGFTFRQEYNPLTGQLEDVIVIGNLEYFLYLADFIYEGGADCTELMYPEW